MVNLVEIDKIKVAASDFREAIEECKNSLGISFRNFPRGSCGDVAPLLGTYLIENNLGKFEYYLGDYGVEPEENWSSHAWLQNGNLVVDITADQFPEISERVIVSVESLWHAKLCGKAQHIADYRIYDPRTVANLGGMYRQIKEHIKST